MKFISVLLLALTALTVAGCASTPRVVPGEIDTLAQAIENLGPEVDPAEARRAAEIAYTYPLQLAQEYRITSSPIVHNAKIINGFRERGLCNDWAEDMLKRLRQENFQTLSLHWITSPRTPYRIIHHSALISAKGDGFEDGIVLDPWRKGGNLFWSAPEDDKRYDWRPRMEVREDLLNGRPGTLPAGGV